MKILAKTKKQIKQFPQLFLKQIRKRELHKMLWSERQVTQFGAKGVAPKGGMAGSIKARMVGARWVGGVRARVFDL